MQDLYHQQYPQKPLSPHLGSGINSVALKTSNLPPGVRVTAAPEQKSKSDELLSNDRACR